MTPIRTTIADFDGTSEGLEQAGSYLRPSAARERVRDANSCQDHGASVSQIPCTSLINKRKARDSTSTRCSSPRAAFSSSPR